MEVDLADGVVGVDELGLLDAQVVAVFDGLSEELFVLEVVFEERMLVEPSYSYFFVSLPDLA